MSSNDEHTELIECIRLPYPENSKFLDLIINTQNYIIDSKDPTWIIKGLNNLRRILKHNRDLFEIIFNNIFDKLKKVIEGENENISYVSLVFLKEFLSESWLNSNSKEWLKKLIPAILNLSSSDNEKLSNLSLNCLEKISKYSFHQETIICLIEQISNSNPIVSLNSSKTLHSFLL